MADRKPAEKTHRVICTTPHATSPINGVEFTQDRGQLISVPLTQAAADAFQGIPGYEVVEVEQEPDPAPKRQPGRAQARTDKPTDPPSGTATGDKPDGDGTEGQGEGKAGADAA